MIDAWIVLLVSLAVLGRAAQMVIDSSIKLAKFFGVSDMAVGFILLAVATSLPEFFISVIASFENQPGISIGNVLGANLMDIGIILGLPLLFTRIAMKGKEKKNLERLLIAITLIPLLLILNLEPLTGLILMSLFAVYAYSVLRDKMSIDGVEKVTRKEASKSALMFFIGVLLLVGSSKYAVESAVEVASLLGVSRLLIASTVISMGTTLPELAVSIAAVKRKRPALAVGNAIGSCMTNLTLVLGTSRLINPHMLNNLASVSNLIIFQAVMSIVLLGFLRRGKDIGRKQGFILILIYLFSLASSIILEFL